MIRISTILLILLLVISPFTNGAAGGSDQELREEIAKYFDDVREHNTPDSKVFRLITGPQSDLAIEIIANYLADSLTAIQSRAVQLLHHIGQRNKTIGTQQRITSLLAAELKGENTALEGAIINYLYEYPLQSYSDGTIKRIKGVVSMDEIPHPDRLVKFYGFLYLYDMIPAIQVILGENINNPNIRWACQLALARLGVDEQIDLIVSRAAMLPVDNRSVYNLYPDLVYVRDRATIDFLIEILFKDEYSCSLGSHGSNCAYRVMELLAPIIEGFPLGTDSNGTIITNNYQKSLTIVRQWFTQNMESYVIIKTD